MTNNLKTLYYTHKYSFERLEVWQKARILVKKIYKTTSDFPSEEKFGIISQIRRAAISVTCNLSEGSSRTSKKDQAHFTQLSFSSLMETLDLLILSKDLIFLNDKSLNELRSIVEEISNGLNALRNYQLSSETNTSKRLNK